MYGPMFENMVAGGWGYLYGAILLLQRMLLLWLIGCTVQPAGEHMWQPGYNTWQLWAMVFLHGIQVLFLLTQMPYNDRFENVVQTVVSFNQGAFFLTMGLDAWGMGFSNPGRVLNNLNMIALAVVMFAAGKAQAPQCTLCMNSWESSFELCKHTSHVELP